MNIGSTCVIRRTCFADRSLECDANGVAAFCANAARGAALARYAMGGMKLRRAIDADVATIVDVVRRIVPEMRAADQLQWDDAYPNAKTFARDIANGELWVAEVDACLAGVAAITTEQYKGYAQLGWDVQEPAIVVHRLLVDPAFRRRGIAGALMRQAEAVAATRGIAVLRVDTDLKNDAARRMFERLGYVLAGEFSISFRPGMRFVGFEKRRPI